MTLELSLIKQAYATPVAQHGKIVYRKNQAKVLSHGEAATKGWKKASAAQILHVLLKHGQANPSSPDLKENAAIAKMIKDRKDQKSSAKHFKSVRNFFSKLQNFVSRLGFQTSAQMQQKIQILADPTRVKTRVKTKSKPKKGNEAAKLAERKAVYDKKQFGTFKAARLANTAPVPVQAVDLKSKLQGHEKEITELLDKVEKGHFYAETKKWEAAEKNGSVPFGRAMSGGPNYAVFEILAIPGVIFKMPKRAEVDVAGRYQNTQFCRELVKNENWDRLFIPQQEFIEELDGKKVAFLIEEKVEIGHYSRTDELYMLCSSDPELKESFKQDIEQLTAFFCRTKFRDGKSDNMPILENGRGIALIDLDDFDPTSPYGGLIDSNRDENIGLVKLVHPDFIPLIQETAKKSITAEDFAKVDFDQVLEESKKRFETLQALEAFHAKMGVVDEKSSVRIDVAKLGLSPDEQAFVQKLIEVVNAKLQANEHLPLRAQRNVHFKPFDDIFQPLFGKYRGGEDFKMPEKVLKVLVEKGMLFSYRDRYGHGMTAQF